MGHVQGGPRQGLSIALVGMPGCGKSTVGRHLARHLGMRFADSDAEVERRVGCSIREYFDRAGEDVQMRRIESYMTSSSRRSPN